MKKVLVILLAINGLGYSEENIDSQCRVQAKEAAITTYQSCVKEARTVKIDEIRKEYQEKLSELKNYYDGELKKLSTTKSSADNLADEATATAQPTIQIKKKSSSGKNVTPKTTGLKQNSKSSSIVTKLPTKKTNSQTLPVQNLAPSDPETKDISTNTQDSNEEKTFETEL